MAAAAAKEKEGEMGEIVPLVQNATAAFDEAQFLKDIVFESEKDASLQLSLGRAYECEGSKGMQLFPLIEDEKVDKIVVKQVGEQSGGSTTGFGGCSLDQEKLRPMVAVAVATPPPGEPSWRDESVEGSIGFGRPMQTQDFVYHNPPIQCGSQISTETHQAISTKGKEIMLANAPPELVAAAMAKAEKGKSAVAETNVLESSELKSANFYNPEMTQIGTEVLKEMPTVITTGGRKIEGFLYKYVNSQVCIVCVCHGKIFSPAGFIKHAGDRDVENPLKHITVLTKCFW